MWQCEIHQTLPFFNNTKLKNNENITKCNVQFYVILLKVGAALSSAKIGGCFLCNKNKKCKMEAQPILELT